MGNEVGCGCLWWGIDSRWHCTHRGHRPLERKGIEKEIIESMEKERMDLRPCTTIMVFKKLTSSQNSCFPPWNHISLCKLQPLYRRGCRCPRRGRRSKIVLIHIDTDKMTTQMNCFSGGKKKMGGKNEGGVGGECMYACIMYVRKLQSFF